MGSYIPSTLAEREEMLKVVGVKSFDELFSQIPNNMKLTKLNIPDGKSELETNRFMQALAQKNKVYDVVFRGAGAYKHYIPSIVKTVTSKEEFLTAYTPYQAEISQGVLQSIFEYQTMMCELTGMDVSNASIYDGATAAAEAVAMCVEKKRKKVLVSQTINPMTLTTINTYCEGTETDVVLIPEKDGITDCDALSSLLDETVAAVMIQQPNFYGQLEDAVKIGEITHEKGAKYIMSVNPIACAVLKTPGECGADIAVGEGQPLGLPLSFGGPYLGFITCTNAMLRKIPGRIVGETVDVNGKRAFVLTLQAREQHIRREKASSNVCSNQAHCALTASVYMSVMGAEGLKNAANQCISKSHYLAKKLSEIKGFELVHKGEFFHEFVTKCPNTEKIINELSKKGILGGYPIESGILWCVTELNTKEQMDMLVSIIKEVA